MEKEIEVLNKQNFFNKIGANYVRLGFGSEGTTYDHGNNVIKILDGYNNKNLANEQYLQFSNIKSKHFYFIKGIYTYHGKAIAVVMKKCPGKNLLNIAPLSININKFFNAYSDLKEETIELTDKNILIYDAMCNCMYSPNNIGIVDTTDYKYSDLDKDELLISNFNTIQIALLDFIVEGYFNYYISQNNNLKNLYDEIINKNINVFDEFLYSFKKQLEEETGKEITYLKEAQKVIRKTDTKYPRII